MFKKNITILITLLGIVALGLSACASGGSATVNLEDLVDTRWELESLGDLGAEVPVVDGSTVTLEISPDGTIGGTAGCNSYGGNIELADGTLTVGEITSTLIACADQLVMDQETEFLTALRSATGVELDGDQLRFLYNEGKSALNFIVSTGTVEPEG